jgi:DNA-binding LytR/AlgR family response regulator
MTTALIADDEPHLRTHLLALLERTWPALRVVAECENGHEAADRIQSLAPDVAFLDIKMPGLTGLQVAQGIEVATRVVFVTAYDEFALQAFERAAVDYLLKPVTAERLAKTVARVQAALACPPAEGQLAALLAQLARGAALKMAPLRWIRASRGAVIHQIAIDDVICFQADDKVTLVLTEQGEHVIRTPLSELLQALDGERFWQVHRSTVVNVERVASARRGGDGHMALTLRGLARPVPVSRAYQHLFKQM